MTKDKSLNYAGKQKLAPGVGIAVGFKSADELPIPIQQKGADQSTGDKSDQVDRADHVESQETSLLPIQAGLNAQSTIGGETDIHNDESLPDLAVLAPSQLTATPHTITQPICDQEQQSQTTADSPSKSFATGQESCSPKKRRGRPRKGSASISPTKALTPYKQNMATSQRTPLVASQPRGRPRKASASVSPVKSLPQYKHSVATNQETPIAASHTREIITPKADPISSANQALLPLLTPRANALAVDQMPAPTPNLMDLESPQIGTTLLRRESVRRRGSPRKRNSGRGRSPQKKQLKKRDTLQERDILQKFSEGAETERASPAEVPDEEKALFDMSLEKATEIIVKGGQHSEAQHSSSLPDANTMIAAETLADSEDIQRAVEAIEVCEEMDTVEPVPGESLSPSSDDAINEANQAIAKAEVEEAQEKISEVCEKVDFPLRKTRSGTRFSDDTTMLKDFLSRAQASKAAKTIVFSPKVPKSLQESPKRSPKKRQVAVSLEKAQDGTTARHVNKSGASPHKAKLEMAFEDDIDDDLAMEPDLDPVPCRRSTRTRLPAPPKTPPGAPSLIPVRRADGTDPVILHKTQAQELAIMTRANTRRNKGQAKPPQHALKDLPVDDAEIIQTDKQAAANGKAVAWAETLTSYQGAKELPEEPEEQRPKVRRLRGLGAANGTPGAKKKGAAATPSNGTPAPKRRGKLTA